MSDKLNMGKEEVVATEEVVSVDLEANAKAESADVPTPPDIIDAPSGDEAEANLHVAKRPVSRKDMTRAQWTWKEMKRNKVAYMMVAPFMILFFVFTIFPSAIGCYVLVKSVCDLLLC